MSSTHPIGTSHNVNQMIVVATMSFSTCAVLSLVAAALAWPHGPNVAGSLIYGTCLGLSSLFSYLYNRGRILRRRQLLRFLDHAGIFLLIAGTYTPFATSDIHGPFGLPLVAWIWGLASLGIIGKLFLDRRYDRLFVFLYLATGWLFVLAIGQVVSSVPPVPLSLLAVGGLSFTIGALIYRRDIGHWTDAVWHGCVLIGLLTHFAAVILWLQYR